MASGDGTHNLPKLADASVAVPDAGRGRIFLNTGGVPAVRDGDDGLVHTFGGASASVTSPTTIAPDDAAVIGVGTTYARADHKHAIVADVAGAAAIGDAAAEGVSTSFARADHKHSVAGGTPGAIAPDDSASAGAAVTFARSDHRHSIVADVAGTIAPDDSAAEGVATSFARSDHRHAIVAATAVDLTDSTNAEGVATSFARSDHTHSHGARTGGTLHALATPNTAGTPLATGGTAGFAAADDLTKLRTSGVSIFNVRYYGAVGDGSTNDTAAFAAATTALNAAPRGGVIYLPTGVYNVDNGSMNITASNAAVVGADRGGAVILNRTATGDCITLSGGAFLTIRDICIFAASQQSSGCGINVVSASDVLLVNLQLNNQFDGIYVRATAPNATGGSFKVTLRNYEINNPKNSAITVDNGQVGDTYIGNGIVSSNPASRPAYGVRLMTTGHCEITELNCTGATTGLMVDPHNSLMTGLANRDVTYVFINPGTLFDSCATNAANFNAGAGTARIRSIHSNGAWFAGTIAGGAAGVITQGSGGIIDDVTFTACRILANQTHGIQHGFGTNLRVIGCTIAGNSAASSGVSDGVNIAAAVSNWTVQNSKIGTAGPQSTATQKYGVNVVAGASNNYGVYGNDLVGNVTAPILDAGTGVVKQLAPNTGGLMLGKVAAIVANSAALAATDTSVLTWAVPTAACLIGTTFVLRFQATNSAASIPSVRAHFGPLGTTSDPVIALTAPTGAIGQYAGELRVTIRTLAAGTANIQGSGYSLGIGAPIAGSYSTTAVVTTGNTSGVNTIMLSASTATGTLTFTYATIEVLGA